MDFVLSAYEKFDIRILEGEEYDMDARVKKIVENSANIVFFGGAGVSTESGIPDFRSESGLYSAMSEYGYPPEEILSRTFFDRHTETFFDYYKKNLVCRTAKPNKAHIALAKLEEEGRLKAIVTQNIDGLHQMAGSKNVLELHGSILRNYCMKCHAPYDLDFVMDERNCRGNGAVSAKDESAKEGKGSQIPRCPKCGGIIKPDVVLYEEMLNEDTMRRAIEAISKADTLIIGGTSLVVYPAAGMINYFHGKNLILINKSSTSYDSRATLVINEAIGEVLG